jgi:ferredoxin
MPFIEKDRAGSTVPCVARRTGMLGSIAAELRRHAPFTTFGALTGIGIMVVFVYGHVPRSVSHGLFWSFHPFHVILSAMVTAGMYRLHASGRWWVSAGRLVGVESAAVMPRTEWIFCRTDGRNRVRAVVLGAPEREYSVVKYRIEIDRGLCIGDELCCSEAPATFEMDDENKAVVTDPDGDPPEAILSAAQNCPVDAIVLHDAESGVKVWPKE